MWQIVSLCWYHSVIALANLLWAWWTFLVCSSEVQCRETEKCKSRQKQKFEKLLSRSRGKWTSGSSERSVVNLSNQQLQLDELAVLEKGPNFALTPNWIPYKEMVAAIENCLQRLPEEFADAAHLQVGSLASFPKQKSPLQTSQLENEEPLSNSEMTKAF